MQGHREDAFTLSASCTLVRVYTLKWSGNLENHTMGPVRVRIIQKGFHTRGKQLDL